MVLILGLVPALAHADPPQKPPAPPHKPHSAAPAKPGRLSDLGRYVALAPRCKLRDPLWAERLDVALNQAISEAGTDPMSGQRALAETELQAANDARQNSATACRALASPNAEKDLRKADELVK